MGGIVKGRRGEGRGKGSYRPRRPWGQILWQLNVFLSSEGPHCSKLSKE